MATPRFLDVFSGCFCGEIAQNIENALLSKCNLNIDERYLDVEITSSAYITNETQIKINSALRAALQLKGCDVGFVFTGGLSVDACSDIAEELKIKNPAVNGYLSGADYEFLDGRVVIALKHGGYEKILESNFVRDFAVVVKNRFGAEVDVEFVGQLEDVEMELPPIEAPVIPQSKPQKKTEEKKISFEKRKDKPQNGIVYLDNPVQFYGRRTDFANIKPMIEVSPDDSEICCWGEVFGVEVRKINTKRGESNILSFSFSDYTNSISCSMFMDPKKMESVAQVKNGNFLAIRGFYEFDNYKKEFILKPKAMAVLQSYSETDDYEGDKRIELHCHTNMSEKDAVCSAKRVVELKDLKIETIEPSQEKKTAIVEAYLNNDTDYLTEMALEQEDDGAEIINLNLSLLDEKNCPLENIEIALQAISTVSALPVYIDSNDKDIVLTALRAFEGRALVKAGGDAISELALYGAAII
jgi:DNA polymerase-3 subunit alpha (Gram-positive type)